MPIPPFAYRLGKPLPSALRARGKAARRPSPHNPDGLTKAQVGCAPWRLLDEDEIRHRISTLAIESWVHIESRWHASDYSGYRGNDPHLAYRTRLTRRQLAALP